MNDFKNGFDFADCQYCSMFLIFIFVQVGIGVVTMQAQLPPFSSAGLFPEERLVIEPKAYQGAVLYFGLQTGVPFQTDFFISVNCWISVDSVRNRVVS